METKKLHINTLEFAQKNYSLNGDLAVRDLPRLRVLVLDSSSEKLVHYKLLGKSGTLGLPGISLHLEADLVVTCQRCLSNMPLNLELDLHYVVSKDAPAELDDMDEVDWLEIDQSLDMTALIEDELLLALPIAPMHDYACAQQSMESGDKPNPFAVLKNLKTSKTD